MSLGENATMSRFLVSLGTATLVLLTAPSVQAAPVSIRAAVQSLTDHEIAYAKKGGWKGWWKHATIEAGDGDRHRGHPPGAGGVSTAGEPSWRVRLRRSGRL